MNSSCAEGAGAPAQLHYVAEEKPSSSTAFRELLVIEDASCAESYAVRVGGQNLTWRVVCAGAAGREVVGTATNAAGPHTVSRATGLPSPWGGSRLVVEVRLTAGTTPTKATCEVTLIPIRAGGRAVRK